MAEPQQFQGKTILDWTDRALPVNESADPGDRNQWDAQGNPINKNWSGIYLRTVYLDDGTKLVYRWDGRIPENSGADQSPTFDLPVGSTLISRTVDKDTVAIQQNKEELNIARQRAEREEAAQRSTQAANLASQTGVVTQPDASGGFAPVLGPDGKPQPTLAAQAEARQASTAQAQAEASRASAEASKASAAAQMANVDVNREQNRITEERNQAQAIYEQAQLAATKERDRLNGLVSIGQLQAEQAKQAFTQWLETNVKVPFMQMEEQRARAQEQRDAQKAEDLRRQNAATFSQEREKSALGFGKSVMDAAVSTLPYMAGPTFGTEAANAINSVAKGSSKGINFTSSGLTFTPPNFEEIALNATAKALSHLSPYAKAIAEAGERPGGAYATGDYSGIPSPALPSSAPAPFDPSAILNQLPYGASVPSAPAAALPATSGEQPEEWR